MLEPASQRRLTKLRHCANNDTHRGVAAVELAVCLPVLVTIIFGGIQAANMIFVKQAVSEAAYEGALYGSKVDATQAETISRVQAILSARNIQGTAIVAGNGSTTIDQMLPGEILSVSVTATSSSNTIGPQIFPVVGNIGAEIFARKL